MKIKLFDKIICRTPAFGINQTLTEVWKELKLKIEESSPLFHELIKSLLATDLDKLDDKTRFTVWKYFNRAKFRATPFGSFAAIAQLKIAFNEAQAPVLHKTMVQHHWIDWSHRDDYIFNGRLTGVNYLLSNTSIYFVGNEIRYIKATEGSFELNTVSSQPELNAILLTCKRKTNPATLFELMKYTFDFNEASTTAVLEQLINLQLLHTDLQANITGKDYFNRLNIPCTPKPGNYIISERMPLSGSIDVKNLKSVPAMISFFTQHLKIQRNTDLTNFIHAFSKRFENQEVCLAIVMDPEVGIGYGDLAQLQNNNLVDEIRDLKTAHHQETINYGELQQFLLEKLINNTPIDLSEFKAEADQHAMVPNTFSLVFHNYKGQPVLANVGGSTANALLGRFTILSPTIEAYGKEIAALEGSANADVIFFDIAYQAEKKVDNVNRRKQLYAYELPILTWSETEHPLDLTDILVTVEKSEVILKSKKLGKRLIPRIPSAYNYNRSDLAVYRFLCDIQNQGLLTKLSFTLHDLFPKLTYYPRVCFKEIIVCPAMWLLPSAALKDLISLKDWLAAKQLKAKVKVGQSDQSLTINLQDDDDIWALWNYGKQQNADFYLTEALLDEEDYIKDEHGNTYAAQYIASYNHEAEIYKSSIPHPHEDLQLHLPGSEWLYFEIYCHPAKSNYLLFGLLSRFLKANNAYLKKWFYIRYTDPKPHLRLRLHLKNKSMGFTLMNTLQNLLLPEMQIGFVTDFKLQTYQKEIARYGLERMDLVEAFFKLDSLYALQLIKQANTDEQLMIGALQSIQILCNIGLVHLNAQVIFIDKMAQRFAQEMNLEPLSFKKLNSSFNFLKDNLKKAEIIVPTSISQQWENGFKVVMANCKEDYIKEKMLGDLIHMHVNRLFITDQRVYETIIYHYIKRIIHTKLALSKVRLE